MANTKKYFNTSYFFNSTTKHIIMQVARTMSALKPTISIPQSLNLHIMNMTYINNKPLAKIPACVLK